MKKVKKLIRHKVIENLKEGEWEWIDDPAELNKLYALKVLEELEEIKNSDHKDIMEFADLIQVTTAWAQQNGFSYNQIIQAMNMKFDKSGMYSRIALNNLNPNNSSNNIYFRD